MRRPRWINEENPWPCACREVDVVPRDQRDSTDLEIHYKFIASGNNLGKKAAEPDEILGTLPKHVQNKCLCIDMEMGV